jgi:hydroxyacylglutathione hydrolase
MRKGVQVAYQGFDVHVIPVLNDNFSYLVRCTTTNEAALVDVPSFKEPEQLINSLSISKFCIMTTHKHLDHSAANKQFAAKYGSDLKIIGGIHDNVPAVTTPVEDGETFSVGKLNVSVMHTPCHTKGHVLYHVTGPTVGAPGALFTGDTLFVGGIGAFFEGNAKQMVEATSRIAAIENKQTGIFPGHEYTTNFLKFTRDFEPGNEFAKVKLAEFEKTRQEGLPTVPSTIADEMKFNLFMRHSDPLLCQSAGVAEGDAVKMMQHLYDACP